MIKINQPSEVARQELAPLFRPNSIAFIGASERPNTPASRGLRNCLRHGFSGGLYPINPKYPELFGARCYPSLDSVAESIDLAVVALSAQATLDAVAACRDAGVKVVVACSSGWEEAGPEGEKRADRLREILARSAMRLLGPNCLGSGNPGLGMSLGYNSSFESVGLSRAGPIGLVTQSGAMLGGIILNGEDVGADVGLYAHVGNAMDIGMEEIMEYMIDDPAIEVLALMIEGLRQPKRFVAAARRARENGKPVVVFKAGASELGRQAVKSHTGALAGSDEVFGAVCREEGIIRVDECEDLMQAAALSAAWKHKTPVGGKGLLVYTLSGGAASILADECSSAGLALPALSEKTVSKLSELLPSYSKVENPFDVGGGVFSDPELPRRTMSIAVEDAGIGAVLWVGVGAPRDERSHLLLDQALDVLGTIPLPSAIVPVSGFPQEQGFGRARQLGVPVLRSLRSAATLIAKVTAATSARARSGTTSNDFPALPEGDVIDEMRSKAVLAGLGFAIPDWRIAERPEDVGKAAGDLGFPVVVKGLADGIAHKSEHGLVALRLDSENAASAAAAGMAQGFGGGVIRRFLIERMVRPGVEVVLGIKHDEEFGPVLMFGLGGIAIELFRDVAFGMCPLDHRAARDLIALTRASELLRGYRGQPPADVDALVDAMVRLSQYAAHHAGQLAELDINPLVVLPIGDGVVALDAVIVTNSPAHPNA